MCSNVLLMEGCIDMFYQIVSKLNDVNGNPHRLIFEYDEGGLIVRVTEVGTSQRSNYQHTLDNLKYKQLTSFSLTVKEYNGHKRDAKQDGILYFAY